MMRRLLWMLAMMSGLWLHVSSLAEERPTKSALLLPRENGMAGWRKPAGAWMQVGAVSKSKDDEKLLTSEAGNGIVVNGATGKTVNLFTEAEHGDADVHVEFMIPKGSNSGVYFLGRYEIQVLDSFGVAEPHYSDCGGIYQRWDPKRGAGKEGFEGHAPRVNACKAPGEWQTLDVEFRAPRFDENGTKTTNARFVKVTLNGKVIHENVDVQGPTRAAAFEDEKPTGPLMFQGDHGPVAYRNLRIKPVSGSR